ncbi:transglutaminase domain-containing protein [Pontibacter fetidus]|uniref:Transglutaminase-like domain-containing protein n=1 Tax=Pontibacter fetidus TaxID=2700082 RepID=A0A6B2H670_9BACT|nr:transglutaminase domain-containing protein [Pontibacter fetidus]NDK55827.1 hypothetical protein [Pontibacter fetidus]
MLLKTISLTLIRLKNTLPAVMRLQLLLVMLLVPVVHGFAANIPSPERLKELDQFAFSTDVRYTKDVKTLAAYLNKGATSDYERARIIFAWVAKNIRYNDYGYNSGNFGNTSVEAVLETRLSVCDGYARLYKALGEQMGLKVEKVSGYAKGYSYAPGKKFTQTNHAWNSVYLNGRWRLVDATWGSGAAEMVNGKLKSKFDYTPYWFDTDPYAFLFSHLPKSPEWQHIPTPITLVQYERMISVDESLFKLGVDASDLLQNLLSGQLHSVATTWHPALPIQIANAPLEGKLQHGKTYTLAFTTSPDVELIVLNNKKWFYFETKGTTHNLQVRPTTGSLAVMARKKGTKGNYSYFMEYKVGG